MENAFYRIQKTKAFKKDLKRLKKSGFDVLLLYQAIDLLANGDALPSVYRDHALQGSLHGTRECHISPDWLLLYKKNERQLILVLVRTGDHRHVLNRE